MDPESWEDRAQVFARSTSEALDALQREIGALPAEGTFRTVWERVQLLGDAIGTAPAIASPDKIALQRRLNTLVRELRERQRAFHRDVEGTRGEIHSRLSLARDTLADAEVTAEVQEVRADLALLRDRITGLPSTFPRSARSQLWSNWQETNRLAWDRLSALWASQEAALGEILDAAEEQVRRRQTRAARDTIKAFHDRLAEVEISHRSARTLRQRANELWQTAAERGREQREHYLAATRRRLERLRRAVRDREFQRTQLQSRVLDLERHVSTTSTGVGHALARGQLAEAQRALRDADRDLVQMRTEIHALEETIGEAAPSTA